MKKSFPQYAMNRAPEVIAAIQRNKAGKRAALERMCEFAKAHGINNEKGSVYPTEWGTYFLSGIVSEGEPKSGRWKRMARGDGWVPYKNNPLSAEFESLRFQSEPVPGLPYDLHSFARPDGTGYMAVTNPFIWDGAAYIGVNFVPETDLPNGSEWVEIKASELHAAMEAYNEANR